MLYYKLDKEISGEKILSDIQKLILKTPDSANKILTISIKDISDYAGDNLLPKITYDPNCIT